VASPDTSQDGGPPPERPLGNPPVGAVRWEPADDAGLLREALDALRALP
jgi:hypothetical protein